MNVEYGNGCLDEEVWERRGNGNGSGKRQETAGGSCKSKPDQRSHVQFRAGLDARVPRLDNFVPFALPPSAVDLTSSHPLCLPPSSLPCHLDIIQSTIANRSHNGPNVLRTQSPVAPRSPSLSNPWPAISRVCWV